jgi:hypothetical protein
VIAARPRAGIRREPRAPAEALACRARASGAVDIRCEGPGASRRRASTRRRRRGRPLRRRRRPEPEQRPTGCVTVPRRRSGARRLARRGRGLGRRRRFWSGRRTRGDLVLRLPAPCPSRSATAACASNRSTSIRSSAASPASPRRARRCTRSTSPTARTCGCSAEHAHDAPRSPSRRLVAGRPLPETMSIALARHCAPSRRRRCKRREPRASSPHCSPVVVADRLLAVAVRHVSPRVGIDSTVAARKRM